MGISGSGGGRQGRRRNGWRNPGDLAHHFEMHQDDRDFFGMSMDEYHEAAWDVINNRNTVRGFRQHDRATGHFNPRDGRMVITDDENRKRSFYTPDRGERYFREHFPEPLD